MNQALEIILYTTLAGFCIPLGGLLASVERLNPAWLENEFRHFVIAFGGGVLVGAVALVLIPEGSKYLSYSLLNVLIFIAGGLCFFQLDRLMAVKKLERPQFSAMMLDYLPESMALGGAFALGSQSAPLLALFIGLQNIPEGFNAYRELESKGHSGGQSPLRLMWMLVPLGPVMGLAGWFWLGGHVAILGGIMLFASGGILYLIFQDIAPQSKMQRHWAPPLGAVLGFGLCLLGTSLLH